MKFHAFRRKYRIFKVVRKGRPYYVRVFDGCACMMIAEQSGCRLDKCERAPGYSKSALDMGTYILLERYPKLRRGYKLGMSEARVKNTIRKIWREEYVS